MLKCKHLEESQMTYLEHWIRAMKFAVWSVKMYFACVLHAVFPCIFADTFSENVLRLAKVFEDEKNAEH